MASRAGGVAVLTAAGLVASGLAAAAAWHERRWGLLAGALLIALWLATLHVRAALRPRLATASPPGPPVVWSHRSLIDTAPTPMLAVDASTARALNRAARQLFATSDRVLPLPPGLVDPDATHLRHAGRRWRIARVVLEPRDGGSLVTLVDVEQEEITAQARASAELIQVLGHELLNGLAPIVSLAESGHAVVTRPDPDPVLLRDILGTLARRAEALGHFVGAYRALARLPEPVFRAEPVKILIGDLARLFAERWPGIALSTEVADGPSWPMDREQIGQAVWALLQNAAEAAAGREADRWVTLRVERTDAALIVAVLDGGPGVVADEAARIFRPFHTTKPDGSGVGLSLARQIAQGHGGTLILVAGTPTQFRMALPHPSS